MSTISGSSTLQKDTFPERLSHWMRQESRKSVGFAILTGIFVYTICKPSIRTDAATMVSLATPLFECGLFTLNKPRHMTPLRNRIRAITFAVFAAIAVFEMQKAI